MKKIVVTGCGQLGSKVVEDASKKFEVVVVDKAVMNLTGNKFYQIDITDKGKIAEVIEKFNPSCVIHTAAIVDVDFCEENKDLAWKVNVEGTRNIAEICRKNDIKMVYFSTDFIFDGKMGDYREDDKPNPLSVYGRTKLEGEEAVKSGCSDYLICRTAVPYGLNPAKKSNFGLWVIEKLKNNEKINVFTDQINSPTFIDDFSMALSKLIEINASGTYNVTGSEAISRYEFARKVVKIFGFDEDLVNPIISDQLRQKAQRPKNASLNIDKITKLGIKMSNIEEGLTKLKSQMVG